MKRTTTVYTWALILILFVFWACGVVIGYAVGHSVGKQHYNAQCFGWQGRFLQATQCDNGYSCTGASFGPFWTQNCNDPSTYVPPPPAAP